MKKIICLCTIVLMMLGLFACETEQSGSGEGTEVKTVKTGSVLKLTLDSQGAKTVGTKQIYLKYNDGYYFERSCETKIGLKANPIECPTKIGHIFRGYCADKDGKGQAVLTENGYLDVDAGFDNFTSDTTLYAIWEKIAVYEIKYYETKGAMNTNVKTFTESDNVTLNKNIAADGFKFLGWFDAAFDGREVTGWSAGQKTADVSLWAYWTANTYTVTLSNDGVTIGTQSVTATYNANLPNITIPTKTGFQFAGYYTEANGVGTKYIDKDGKGCHIWNIADNTTLYADWLENDGHFITYIGADDSDNSANPATFKESQNVTIQNITRTGYDFNGWWSQAEGGTRVTGWAAGDKTDNVILYARWIANEYTVTLTSNGTTTGTKSVTAVFGETVPDITIPTKNGSQFLGYYAGENGIGTKYIDADGKGCHIWDIADNTTLFADWLEKVHNITYIGADDCDNSDNPTTFKESEAVTIQNISRSGYVFGGWYDAETEGTKVTNWAALSKTDDVTLYARWTPISYTVAYYANGGSGSMQPQSFTYGEAQNLTSCGFTAPTGMKFSMWNTRADGLGLPYTDGQSVSNLTTNNATIQLFAQWVDKATHNITYNNIKTADNGLNPLTFGESQNITLQNLSLPGWDFNGWWTAENGGSQITGWNAGTKTDDVTLYARWTIQTYTITYKDQNGNNFSGTMSDYPQSHTYGTVTPLVIPTKDYYNFEGWHLRSDCFDNSIDRIAAETISANTTLYAKWIPIEYHIIYNNVLNGMNTNQTTFTIEDNITLSDIVRTGYTHNGWWTESEGGSQVTGWDAGAKTEDVTVYSRWTANSYTIVFNANGGTGNMSDQIMTYDMEDNLTTNSFTFGDRKILGWSIVPQPIGLFHIDYNNEGQVLNLCSEENGEITLYGVWGLAAGDIAYSDGTFSSVYNAGKTPIGIVCYTNTDGTSGKIVHLSEQSSLRWCLDSADGHNCNPATSTWGGSNNWQIICDAISDEDTVGNYPAFEYVNNLGNGWYMPAKDELNQIYINKEVINTALNALSSGGVTVTTLGASYYWSSSSYSDYSAWYQRFSDGDQYDDGFKDTQGSVRAVRAF